MESFDVARAGRALLLPRLWTAPLDCGLTAILTGPGFAVGVSFGALSLTGDALSSAVKRRLALAPGTEIPGLDQLPEALLPCIVLAGVLGLDTWELLAAALGFLLLDLLVQPLSPSR